MAKSYASRLKGVSSTTDDSKGYDILGHLRDAGTFVATGQMPQRTTASNTLADRLAIEQFKADQQRNDPYKQAQISNIESQIEARKPVDVEDLPEGIVMVGNKPMRDPSFVPDRPERPLDAARRESYENQNRLFNNLLDGNGGGPKGLLNGGSFPPGTTMKAGPLTIPMNRELTEGESKTLGNAESMGGQISKMRELVQNDKRSMTQMMSKAPFGLGNEDAQRFNLVKNDLVDRLVRMRSGAQINEQEFRRLSSLLPQALRNDKVDLEQLAVFEQEMNNIQGRIQGGANFQPQSAPSSIGRGMVTVTNPETGEKRQLSADKAVIAKQRGWI